jgi:8-oxo-dGTP diphosphatase
MTETAVFAAGGVWRVVDGKLRILVIHRTAYADVTLPKGKVDPGETLAETAVREIFEETGIAVHLGIPVGVSRYRMAKGRQKIVHYWAAEATDKAIRASAFVPNKEIAAIEWVSPRKARGYLSYPVDVEILDQFLRYVDDGVLSTFPIIVLRHAKALPREVGRCGCRTPAHRARQAHALVGPLRAFGVRRVVSSDAVRCVDGDPLAAALGRTIERTPSSVRMPGRTAARTFALSSASACVRARAPCCAATVRCCPASSLSSRSRRARSAGRISAAPPRSSPARSRSCTSRGNTPARASPASRRTSRSSDPAPVFRTGAPHRSPVVHPDSALS